MKQVRWFDRKFNFNNDQNIFPSIIERLGGTPVRLYSKIDYMPEEILADQLDGRWSVKQNIGHLIDLEPLWMGRLKDVLEGTEMMRSADLENKKTHSANHNDRDVDDLLKEFDRVRSQMVSDLVELDESQIFKYALHPRLKSPMRIIDLFQFVAEHDDQHLAQMTEMYMDLTED